MAGKIPPSLSWLIKKHARLSGEITKVKKALSRVQHLIDRLQELEASLDAVDNALKLHEIQIDVENIKPIRPRKARSKFRYGEINNLILSYLRSRIDGPPVSKRDIAEHIYRKHLEIDPVPLNPTQLSHCIQASLNRLHQLGCISRCHEPATNQIGLWQAKRIDDLMDILERQPTAMVVVTERL